MTLNTVVPFCSVCVDTAGAKVSDTESVTWFPTATRFQFASTALTVISVGVPAVAVEIPTGTVLPVGGPGTATSPGTRTCNLTAEFTPTVNVEDTTVDELGSSVVPETRVAVEEVVAVAVTRKKLKVVVP